MPIEVVFVEPENPGNIGSVARAMKNFGFKKLVLVNPCVINDETFCRAKHAKDIVQKAINLDNFNELLERYDLLVGSTARIPLRDDRFTRSYIYLSDLNEKLRGVKGRVGLLLGREGKGLYNKELVKCDLLVHIPTSSAYGAMNAGQAAAVLLYELSQLEPAQEIRIASKKEREVLLNSWEKLVEHANIRNYKKKNTYMAFKRLIGRAMITGREYTAMQGVFRKILERNKK